MAHFSNPEGAALLKSGEHSDFTITCNGYNFKVHKIIIGSKSKFFKICTDGNFKETTAAVLDLPEQEPRVLAMALLYMYTGGYDSNTMVDIWPSLSDEPNEIEAKDRRYMETRIKLYKLADNLVLPQLSVKAIDDVFEYPHQLPFPSCDAHNGCGLISERTREEFERRHLMIASLFVDLLDIIYEELHDDHSLRARATVAALESTRPWSYPQSIVIGPPENDSWGGETGGFEQPKNQETAVAADTTKLRDRLSLFFKEHDLVAWNVARHYRKILEQQTSKYDDDIVNLKYGLTQGLSTYRYREWPHGIGWDLRPDY